MCLSSLLLRETRSEFTHARRSQVQMVSIKYNILAPLNSEGVSLDTLALAFCSRESYQCLRCAFCGLFLEYMTVTGQDIQEVRA